jgi:hypothetical protein
MIKCFLILLHSLQFALPLSLLNTPLLVCRIYDPVAIFSRSGILDISLLFAVQVFAIE